MTPQEQLNDLLARLSVQRIVVVDDDFMLSAGAALRAFGESLPELETLPPLPEGVAPEEHLESHWDGVSPEDKIAAKKLAMKIDGFVLPDPTGLRELLTRESPYFKGLTKHEWEAMGDGILRSNERNLVLFDVDFSRETGEAGDESGLALAAAALRSGEHIIGLLTNRAAIGNEEADASEWAERAEVAAAEFVVVNKLLLGDLADTQALEKAVEQIRVTMQASRLGFVRNKVSEALKQGIADVDDKLGGETSAVLEDVVFRSSHDGGEWEGDTWFRVFKTLGLERGRQAVAVDKGVRAAVADVRKLLLSRSDHRLDEAARELLVEVTTAECYEDASFINGAGLPIANGDIFQANTGAMYILVAQPCDVALRPTGRAYDPTTVTLLPVKSTKVDDAFGDDAGPGVASPTPPVAGGKEPETTAQADGEAAAESGDQSDDVESGGQRSAYLLPDGGPFGDGRWEVRFRPEYHAEFDVLDLCSSNTDGRATTTPRKNTALEPLLPGVQQRYEDIKKHEAVHQEVLARIDQLESDDHLDEHLAKKMRLSVLGVSSPFVPSLSKRPAAYDFECTRIGRLAGTYADALLAAHSNARSRTAHAHELTRIVRRD